MRLLTKVLIVVTSTIMSACQITIGGVDDTVAQEGKNSDYYANKITDEQMLKYYLYNEEYEHTSRNLKLNYEDMLYNSLLAMKSNTLDKKPNRYNPSANTLFTNITRSAHNKSRAGESRLSISFGVASVNYILIDDDNIGLCINAVYNGSPASKAGITRGYIVTHINDYRIDILYNTGSTLPQSLIAPAARQKVRLRCMDIDKEITLTAREIEASPVLAAKMIAPKIGYLNLARFDCLFDAETMGALASLNGCQDLIVDLRVNPGGHVMEANRVATSILNPTNKRRFCQYRFNTDLQRDYANTAATFGLNYDAQTNYFYTNYQETIPKDSRLGLKRIYCLVSHLTASASELLINSLRGDGVEVILIGNRTIGKNVGSYPFLYSDAQYDYTLTPIMFEIFNSQGQGDYSTGLGVDHEVNDYSNFCDFSTDDPMIHKALTLIGRHTRSDVNTPTHKLKIVGDEMHNHILVEGSIL